MNLPFQCPPELVYVTDEQPGFTRKRSGRGFRYLDEQGSKLVDPQALERIAALVIPPMWQRLWICANANGHLQATGYDAKGRKQYIYHPLWVAFRQQHKFTRLLEFGACLPLIRARVEHDSRKRNWGKQKILAVVVMVLDNHFLRIGNEIYEKQNQTYGITTLKQEHLVEEQGVVYLAFKGKSGKQRKEKIHSRRLARLIKNISELPGQEIFHYLDEDGNSQKLNSLDVNQYLQEITRQSFTAKDFRTWGGTVLAVRHYQEALQEVEETPRLKLERALVCKVAKVLGNTVSVCKEYYIHPFVLQTLLEGKLEHYRTQLKRSSRPVEGLSMEEQLVMKVLACAKAN